MPGTLRLKPGLPKYVQIRNWIQEMIQKGRYGPGDKLPSEVHLAGLFSVNRNTVRQAIADLVSKGVLEKRNGVGSFVKGQAPSSVKYTLQHISSFTADMKRMGVEPETRLIHKGLVEAPDDVAEKLMLGTDRKVVLTERLRLGNRVPLVLERSYLPIEYRQILRMKLTGSLYDLLTRKFRVDLNHSTQHFRAVALSPRDAALLGTPPGSPGIFLESVIYDASNIPIEVLHALHRGDKYVFEVESGGYRRGLRSRFP